MSDMLLVKLEKNPLLNSQYAAVAYYERFGAKTKTSMDPLVLL